MKILVALSRFPWPLEKGDKLRSYHQLKGLAERHEVHLVCLNEQPVPEEWLAQVSFCASVQVIVQRRWLSGVKMLATFWNGLPFQVNYYRSEAMKAAIAATMKARSIDVCYVQLVRLGDNLPFENGGKWVLDYMDTFSIGMSTRVADTNMFMRPLVRMEAERLRLYETRIAAQFDELIIISDRDVEGLAPLVREAVHVIPNGASEKFFEDPKVVEKEYDIIFFGNMGYHPNVQSARFLVDEVLPLLHKRGLRPRLCIAGARPASVIKAWDGPEIKVTGYVDDIREYVWRSRISVAPLVAGQGLQNKLIEGMAMRMPTITTSLSNAGLGARPGVDLLVCDGPQAIADGIADLLEHPEKAAAIAANGRKYVEEHFRWSAMNRRLEEVLERANRLGK